ALGGDLDRPDRDPGIVRVARTGRDDDATQARRRVVGHLGDGTDLDGVVADDMHLGPGRLECLHEVEGEAVVVVDDEDHGWTSISSASSSAAAAPDASLTPAAISMARRKAAALCSVSSNSRSGTDPATIPAPVWTCAWPSLSTALRMVMAVSRLPS